jgi:hypothetical protein
MNMGRVIVSDVVKAMKQKFPTVVITLLMMGKATHDMWSVWYGATSFWYTMNMDVPRGMGGKMRGFRTQIVSCKWYDRGKILDKKFSFHWMVSLSASGASKRYMSNSME